MNGRSAIVRILLPDYLPDSASIAMRGNGDDAFSHVCAEIYGGCTCALVPTVDKKDHRRDESGATLIQEASPMLCRRIHRRAVSITVAVISSLGHCEVTQRVP